MPELLEYQSLLLNPLEKLEPLVQKYAAPDSPLGKGEASRLGESFKKAKKHCEERLKSGQPKIMLYGVYNSGKSTLINALMGQKLAEMDDKPTTDKVNSYFWRGYELLDTPGIDAPIEHQNISLAALEQCQVILFVVSAHGTFENKYIFETMRDVIRRGKRLFIILNDKEGLGIEDQNMVKVMEAVQNNLIEAGLSDEEAADFRPCPVNALDALEGRLDGEEELVKHSGIHQLEELIVNEIKQVDGFKIATDLCAYLANFVDDLIPQLSLLCGEDVQKELEELEELRKEYRTFREVLERKIEDTCASMPEKLRGCFPSVKDREDLRALDTKSIQEQMQAVFKRYAEDIRDLAQDEVKAYQERVSKKLKESKDNPTLGNIDAPSPDGFPTPDRPNDAPSGDFLRTLRDILEGLPSIIMYIPLPVGLNKILATVLKILVAAAPILVGILDSIISIFSSDKAEEAKRKNEEEYARKVALWLQQQANSCQEMHDSFVKEIKKNLGKSLDKAFAPLFDNAEANLKTREDANRKISADVGLLRNIEEELKVAASTLQS